MGDEFGPGLEDLGIDSEGNLVSKDDQKPQDSPNDKQLEESQQNQRTIHREGLDIYGNKIEWDEPLPDSMKDEGEKMPVDNYNAYFEWLKKFHGSDYVNKLIEADEPAPKEYVYDDISIEDVQKAVEALKQQRQDDPDTLKYLLRNLNPAEIWLLTEDQTTKILTPDEANQAMKDRINNEKQRLGQFPDFHEIAKPDQKNVRFYHATATPEAAELIMQSGLRDHESGLGGVAVRLGSDVEENMGHLASPHRDYKHEIIIALPSPSEKMIEAMRVVRTYEGRISVDAVFSEQLEDPTDFQGTSIDYTHFIPSEFIQGYLNTSNGKFVTNPNYWENLLIQEAKEKGWSDKDHQTYKKHKLTEFEDRGLKNIQRIREQNA